MKTRKRFHNSGKRGFRRRRLACGGENAPKMKKVLMIYC
jgi:hypothetical protein